MDAVWQAKLITLEENGFQPYGHDEFIKRKRVRFGDSYFEYNIAIAKTEAWGDVYLDKRLKRLSNILDFNVQSCIDKHMNTDAGVNDWAKELSRTTKFCWEDIAHAIMWLRKNSGMDTDKIKEFILRKHHNTMYSSDLRKWIDSMELMSKSQLATAICIANWLPGAELHITK